MPAPAARNRSLSVPCGTSSSSILPALYAASNSRGSVVRGYEQITLRTRPSLISRAMPVSPVPALLATMVRLRTPSPISASVSAIGSPTAPKPPHSTVIPSLSPATAAVRSFTRLSIILEGDPIAALERQHLARFFRGRDFERQVFEDGADALHLIGVALGELALADIKRILEADADAAAHDRAHGDERQLMPPCRQDRPVILLAEQPVGDRLHVGDVVRIGADSAENAEDRLHQERRLDQLAVEEMGERIEMADVVAFELEARAVTLAQFLEGTLDVHEGVLEDEVARHLQVFWLPLVLEFLVAVQHRIEPEVHRAHVERAHLG